MPFIEIVRVRCHVIDITFSLVISIIQSAIINRKLPVENFIIIFNRVIKFMKLIGRLLDDSR